MKRGRPPHPDFLTPRQLEVLALVRDGLTNDQIAERLGITERGARYDVSEILSKLGVRAREEAAAWRGEKLPAVLQVLSLVANSGRVLAGRLAVVALGLGCVGLLMLALGVAVMSSRRTTEPTAQADIESVPELAGIPVPVAELAQEAEAEARRVMGNAVLYQLWYRPVRGGSLNGGTGVYTFHFTEPTPMHEIQVIGPHEEPGRLRWEVRGTATGFPNLERMILEPLDLTGLNAEPVHVGEVVAHQSSIPTAAVNVTLGANPYRRHQFGVTRNSGAGVLCDLPAGGDVSQITCPPSPPVAGGPPVVGSP
jgi:DNA-binding CsgD family transcriptional regulator